MAFKMKGFSGFTQKNEPKQQYPQSNIEFKETDNTSEKEWEWVHMLPSEKEKWNYDFKTWAGQIWTEMLPSEKEEFNYDFQVWLNTPSSKKEKL